MRVLCTCPFGLVNVLGTEIKRLGYKPNNNFDTGLYIDNLERSDIYTLNIHSRVANTIWVIVGEGKKISTFEKLFSAVENIDRKSFVGEGRPVVVSVQTSESTLHSMQSVQSISHKAIYKKLCQQYNVSIRKEDKNVDGAKILIRLYNDELLICLSSSGSSLHQRGYRSHTGEAPLKENLAAAMIYMSGWMFNQPLIDVCCGAGSIVIEAGMIARNIPPGMMRKFYFQSMPCFDEKKFLGIIDDAKQKIFRDKKYQIYGYDADPNVLEIAKNNAKNAGVDDLIVFQQKNIFDRKANEPEGFLISNPPYGNRLDINDLEKLYRCLIGDVVEKNNVNATIITPFDISDLSSSPQQWKKNKTFNGPEECRIWRKNRKE